MNTERDNINIKVLMYHRIVKGDAKNVDDPFAVSEHDFRQQLQMIESLNYTPITFEDYNLYLEDKLTLPKKPIILTFDDGYEEIYDIALPLLREFNMRAVIFVLGSRKARYSLWDHRIGDEKVPLLTADQIKAIRKEGFEIGAHSMTHANLISLNNAELEEEIKGAKRNLEELLGEELVTFSYPYGLADDNVRTEAAEAGFKFACGVYTGPPQFGMDRFDIRRLAIKKNTGTFQFLMKLITPYPYVEWAYGKMRNTTNGNTEVEHAQQVLLHNYDLSRTKNI